LILNFLALAPFFLTQFLERFKKYSNYGKFRKILAQAKELLPKRSTTMRSIKTIPWMAASLLATTSIFGQTQKDASGCCVPPPPVCKPAKCCVTQTPQEPIVCAYNAPAEINVGCQGDIDVFVTGSFIYWQASQDNMTIGLTDRTSETPFPFNPLFVPGNFLNSTNSGNFIESKFDYKPGFKVGLGLNLQVDDWYGYAEFTRVHGDTDTSSNGPSANPADPSIFATFAHPFLTNASFNLGAGQLFNSVKSSYRNNLDFVDAEMGRTYYVGRQLIFRSAWGARGAWILQNIHVVYDNIAAVGEADDTDFIASLPSTVNVYQRSHSWAVGPRAGLTMDWMLGCGFRFFGSGYGDLLYTKYKLQDKTVLLPKVPGVNFATALAAGVPVSIITKDRPRGIRTHLDMEMGLGWGSYFDNNNWHFDLSAAYGWQVFFDQNMFRRFTDFGSVAFNIVPNGNLYVQGLTATARLDF
jgi:Legionella pneumophila major outer membrane protein precursor